MPAMSTQVHGTFEVEAQRHPPYDTRPGATLARTSLEKKFAGPLEATSHVEMIGAMSEVKGSAGYVAIERVVGTLAGRAGTFVMQHNGVMDRGAMSLSLTVVPDSGTDALLGLRGSMAIEVVEGQHHYRFDFTLPG